MMRLSSEQIGHLRVLGHDLTPAFSIGAGGITTFVLRQIEHALNSEELVKVRVPFGDRHRRRKVIDQLAPQTRSMLVHRDSHSAVLFRRGETPVIQFPGDTQAVRRTG